MGRGTAVVRNSGPAEAGAGGAGAGSWLPPEASGLTALGGAWGQVRGRLAGGQEDRPRQLLLGQRKQVRVVRAWALGFPRGLLG
jgi:hypothetical protein